MVFSLVLLFAGSCDILFYRDDPRLARVNWKVLRLSEMHNEIGKNSTPQEKEQFVDSWINQRLWEKEAKKQIRMNPRMRRQLREYRRQLLVNEYCERYLRENIYVSENDVLEYYRDNEKDFISREKAVFADLYLCNNADAASEVLQMLGDRKTPPVQPQRQLLISGECAEKLEKALFRETGADLLGPLQIREKYYVVSVLERYRANSQLRVEHVRDEIIQRLKIQTYLDAHQKKQKELRKRSNVKIFKIPD
ncbi:MAG: hypothetical protein U5N56_05095 [Candidatus Marinimicrobia bacterium]|nr:hypothetical protein [Candidatus Neomarinimicrobiota bacterium]